MNNMVWMTNCLYMLAFMALSPLLLWRQCFGRRPIVGFRQKFFGTAPFRSDEKPCIWFHAVSLGEVNLLESIVKHWKTQHPDWSIVISTTTQTGMSRAQAIFANETVFWMPYDFSWAICRVFRNVQPNVIVLAELELWPNLIRLANQHEIPVAVMNGRLGQKSYAGYRRLNWLVRPAIEKLSLIAVQNQKYANRFLALGADPRVVCVTGNIKFDNASNIHQSIDSSILLNRQTVWVAGSTHDPEEQIALSVFESIRRSNPMMRLVLAPRHPERGDQLARHIQQRGLHCLRRSECDLNAIEHSDPSTIILVDVIGELGMWWQRADIAFVGGSLCSRGGQNMLEAAALNCAIAFGPNTWNFTDESELLLQAKGAVRIMNEVELREFVLRCLNEPQFGAQLAKNALQSLHGELGASKRTVELITKRIVATTSKQAEPRSAKVA